MPHFFINSKFVNNDEIIVSDKENYNHIVKSLRAKVGESLLLIDENEVEYKTKITEIDNKFLKTKIESSAKSQRDLSYNLFLAQSPLRSDSQNVIIEKATELGVRGIYPIYTDNCALKKSVITAKIDKWQKIMYEASKQCERANIPTCYDMSNLEILCNSDKFDRIVDLCERNTNGSFKDYLSSKPVRNNENILLIIGPEGGFSEREFDYMKEMNLPMLTLGDLILKAETAVIVTIGNIVYEFGK